MAMIWAYIINLSTFQNIMTFNKCSIKGRSFGDEVITSEGTNVSFLHCMYCNYYQQLTFNNHQTLSLSRRTVYFVQDTFSCKNKKVSSFFQVNAKRVDFSGNSMSEPSFEFYDQSLLDEVVRGEPDTQEFFRLLSVCHTGLVTNSIALFC